MSRGKFIAFLALAIPVLAGLPFFLMWKRSHIVERDAFLNVVERAIATEAMLEQEVLALEAQMTWGYAHLTDLNGRVETLSKTIVASASALPDDLLSAVRGDILRHDRRVAARAATIEQFKSLNAVSRNSKAYLSRLADPARSAAYWDSLPAPERQSAYAIIAQLTAAKFSGDWTGLTRELSGASIGSGGERSQSAALISHIRTIADADARIANLLPVIVSGGDLAVLTNVRALVQARIDDDRAALRGLDAGLIGASIVLSALVAFSLYRVSVLSSAVQIERDRLEERVETRSRELTEASNLLETTLDTIDQGVVVYDDDMNLMVWNKGFERIMSIPKDRLYKGMSIREYYQLNAERGEYGDNAPGVGADDRMRLLGASFEKIKTHRYVRRRPNGQYIEIIGRSMPEGGLVTTYTDITRQKEAQGEIERLAWTDTLTGMLNRNSYRSKVFDLMNKAQAEGAAVALLFIDLDGFKGVNDTYGHDAGDQVLIEVAKRIQKTLRQGDAAIRLGGDEFAAALLVDGPHEQATAVSGRLIENIMKPMKICDRNLTLGASIGVAFFPDDDTCVDELTRKADLALYEAKASGRGVYRVYNVEVDKKARQLRRLEDDLRAAITEKQFELYFQPKVSARTGRIVGAEALIRWNHPELGLIPPGEFISVVEHTNLVFPVGAWVIEDAWRTLESWRDFIGVGDFKLAVNVSTRQFFDDGFKDLLVRLAGQHAGLVDRIELEITEEVMMKDVDEAIQIMHDIDDQGFCITIDDFGTGYSNFSYLSKMPVRKLKIDKLFIDDLGVSEQSESIVSSIVELGHNLDMTVVAEGVETEAQVALLSQYRCDEYQGYYFAAPMTRRDFEARLEAEFAAPRKTA